MNNSSTGFNRIETAPVIRRDLIFDKCSRQRSVHWIIDLKLFNQILNGILDKFKYAQINRTRPILIPCK